MSLGMVTGNGEWDQSYDRILTFKVLDTSYIFFHKDRGTEGNHEALIQELTPLGKFKDPATAEKWQHYYGALTTLPVGGRVFLYGQNEESRSWFIQEILKDGTLGTTTVGGTWSVFYHVMRGFNVGGESYLLYHNNNTDGSNFLYIQQVLSDGTLGGTTESQKWNFYYPVMVPIEIDNRTFIFGHSKGNDNNYWFIQEVSKDGTLGKYVDGYWDRFYEEAFTFKMDDSVFLFTMSKGSENSHPIKIKEVLSNGTFGETTATKDSEMFFSPAVPYTVEDRSWFYGQMLEGPFIIHELVPPS